MHARTALFTAEPQAAHTQIEGTKARVVQTCQTRRTRHKTVEPLDHSHAPNDVCKGRTVDAHQRFRVAGICRYLCLLPQGMFSLPFFIKRVLPFVVQIILPLFAAGCFLSLAFSYQAVFYLLCLLARVSCCLNTVETQRAVLADDRSGLVC